MRLRALLRWLEETRVRARTARIRALAAGIAAAIQLVMKTIEHSELVGVVGGMRWQDLPRSSNIEDRRPQWVKQRDDAWFQSLERREAPNIGTPANIPLPPRRPSGL